MKLLFFIIFLFCFVDLGVCLDDEAIKYRDCSKQASGCGLLDTIESPSLAPASLSDTIESPFLAPAYLSSPTPSPIGTRATPISDDEAVLDDEAVSDDEAMYRNCNKQASGCGVLNNIRYPFWGRDRPEYCGLPGFRLFCSEYTLGIGIKNIYYNVLKIDQENKIMGIVRPELLSRSDCPSTELDSTTTLDLKLFKYTDRVVNITLLTGCNYSYERSLLSDFMCSNYSYYSLGTQSLNRIPPPCKYNFRVPVMKSYYDKVHSNDTLTLVAAGFEVSYGFTADISNCKICENSGGECGYHTRLKQSTCFCRDGRSRKTSSRNGITLSCAGRGHSEKKIVIGTSAAVSSIFVLLLVVLVIFLRNKERERRNDQQIVEAFFKNKGSLALKRYKYFDVKKMTNSFKEKLGQGGYGSVFKGTLNDGHPVAVKLLFTNSKNNGEEFINEVESISQTSHVNVVNLLGFCLEGKKRALIYEFMPNGSLEKFIYNKMLPLTSEDYHPLLGGDTLYQIAIGIARGLEYLHRGCNTRILHFDIKPHNILLDENFCPKIADFGLAKLCTRNESMISFLGARGTTGYIAPEVISRNYGGVSYKSDVYSYGMMILEMVGGRKNIDVGVGIDHSSQIYYPHWIYERLKQNEDIVLHGVIMTEASEEIARKMSIVGLWCIQAKPANRPSMTKVLEMLEGKSKTLQIPPKPFFSSPSRQSPMSSPSAVLMSTKYSPSGSQPSSSSTIVSMSI